MSLRIEPLTAASARDWDAFVERCPGATFFHKAGWKAVIEKAFGHPTYFVSAMTGDRIVGVLPLVHVKSRLFGNALISNAFCVAGGPAADDQAAKRALIAHAVQLLETTGADYVELRDGETAVDGWVRHDELYASFARPLKPDAEAELKQIPRKQRAVVRKALENKELTWTIEADFTDFYRLFAVSVRNHGTPVLPRRFFNCLRHEFGDAMEILTVRAGGNAVSSVLSFYFRDRVLPYYTGSIGEARRLGTNDFMYWQLMRHAAERGASVFDFGRSRRGTGPFHFKKNWGFEPRPVAHDFLLRAGRALPRVTPDNPKYALFVGLWRRLPLPLANALGPLIVRYIG